MISTAFAAVRRRKYLALSGAVASLLLAAALSSAQGPYFTQVDVVFMPPRSADNPNPLALLNNRSVIDMAGIVGRAVGGRVVPQPVSGSVTLLDEGILKGSLVRQPNDGGQWKESFQRPLLEVQVAESSPDQVRATLRQTLGEIDTKVRDMQSAAGTPEENMIRTSLSPAVPDIVQATGSPIRAGLATLLLGFSLTLVLTVAADRAFEDRAASRRVH